MELVLLTTIIGRFSVLSDRPIPAGLKRYYYEVTISVPERDEDDPA